MEYYDCMKDPIKNYFLEKMQNTLVSKEALSILIKGNIEESKEKESEENTLLSLEDLNINEEKMNFDRFSTNTKKTYPQDLLEKMEKIEKYKKLKVFS